MINSPSSVSSNQRRPSTLNPFFSRFITMFSFLNSTRFITLSFVSEGCVRIWPFSLRRLPPLASTRLLNNDFCGTFQAHHASPFTGILQAVAHQPLLALKPLLHLDHHLCADPCTVRLDALVLTTCAAALHFHTMSVPNARNSNFFCHNITPQYLVPSSDS